MSISIPGACSRVFNACLNFFSSIVFFLVSCSIRSRLAQWLIVPIAVIMPTALVNADVVDLYTGTTKHSIPIAVPPGTNGIAPNLSLTYSSYGSGGDQVGSGWSLNGLGSIERRGPNYGPAPTYSASDTFVLEFAGGHKLVNSGIDPSGLTGNYYRTQIETFFRIERVVASDSWVVTDSSGTKYYFGQTTGSRQNNPSNTSQVFRWHLSKIMDTHGVYLTISYDVDFTGGDMYPKQIVYSQGAGLSCTPSSLAYCRSVDFTLKARTGDIPISYVTGGKIISDKLLSSIDVRMGTNLVRRYQLAHSFISAASGRGRAAVNMLASVTEIGADATTATPPTIFTYHTDPSGSSLALGQIPMTGDPVEGVGGPFSGTQERRECTYVVDMNNDRLPDIFVGWAGLAITTTTQIRVLADTGQE